MDRLEASVATQPAHARTPPRLHARLGRGTREVPTHPSEASQSQRYAASNATRPPRLSQSGQTKSSFFCLEPQRTRAFRTAVSGCDA